MSSPDCLDWFFLNPVDAGLISYSDLKNGTLTLYDIYVMNELLRFKDEKIKEAENKAKIRRAMKNG